MDTRCMVGKGGGPFYIDVPASDLDEQGNERNHLREVFDQQVTKGELRPASTEEEAELRAELTRRIKEDGLNANSLPDKAKSTK